MTTLKTYGPGPTDLAARVKALLGPLGVRRAEENLAQRNWRTAGVEIDRRASALAGGMDYRLALRQVLHEDPDLASQYRYPPRP